MADFDGVIDPTPAWPDVPQLGVDAVALGGAGGPMNAQAVALAARTNYINQALGVEPTAPGTRDRSIYDRLFEQKSILNWVSADGSDETDKLSVACNASVSEGFILYWPESAVVRADGSVQNFHQARHYGFGRVIAGTDTWYITPTGSTQTNTMYVGPGGVSSNDGLTQTRPLPMSTACLNVPRHASKADDGVWRIFVFGEISYNGVKLTNWPEHRNPFIFEGPAVADVRKGTLPSARWIGTTATEPYAIRADNLANFLNITWRNLWFDDWDSSTNAGAILMWNEGRFLVENCRFNNTSIGASNRYGYMRVKGSWFEDCNTWGVCVAYNGTGNVGALTQVGDEFVDGNMFIRCGSGAEVGRSAIMYVQGNTFRECGHCVYGSRVSRFRTQANTFESWTIAAVGAALLSAWTPDNNSGYPDTYVQVPTRDAPAWNGQSGSVHLNLHRSTSKSRHTTAMGDLINIANASGVQTQVVTTDGTWIPFRLPGFALYGPDWQMSMEFMVDLAAGAGGTIGFYGAGSATSSRASEISIAPVSVFTRFRVYFDMRPANSSVANTSARCRWRIPELGLTLYTTASLNTNAFRSTDEILKLWRIYFTPSSNATATFYNLVTWWEG